MHHRRRNLEHIIDSGLNSNTIGNYLKETFLTSNFSTKLNARKQHKFIKYTEGSSETNKSTLTLDDLFQSPAWEETSQQASVTTIQRMEKEASPKYCEHHKIKDTCWYCHPEHAPTCSICINSGLSGTHVKHKPNSKLLQLYEKRKFKGSEANALVSTIRFNADSGATDTIVSNKAGLQSYSFITHPIKVANGEFIYATEIGKLQSSTYDLNRVL
ncbi:hypothetical protein ROZALSC1DRAFT_21602 [Rozella allomycis CSF55]|uniref:Uncharacterized protein n=1 Tax=Rozella allomycis (strain CSF55) TaxID=988480 RepID=A0A4P9YMM2_ROZAC|nr:hypothetical protein ROZALSC1DRAFT_21602 [Rozella allomycis CSF55]